MTCKILTPLFLCGFCRMYVHWREREHEAAYEVVADDPAVMATLTQCGLVKFLPMSVYARTTKAAECLS
jgi:hypothetical protein